MQTRRALLASGVAAAVSGCVSAPDEGLYYTIDARTVHRDEGAIRPSISVADARVSADSSAAVDVSFANETSRSFSFVSQPVVDVPIGAPYSTERGVCVREPEFVERSVGNEGRRCWIETEGAAEPVSVLPMYFLDSGETETRRLLLASPEGAEGCLSAGTYTFESTYEVDEAEIDWTFEIEVSDA